MQPLGQRCFLQNQRAAGLHGRQLLRLRDVGHAEPGQVFVDQLVGLAAQHHVVLLQRLAGRGHAHLEPAYVAGGET